MKRVVVVVPHSHSWFWTQTCLSCLRRYPPVAKGCEVLTVVVDNSCDWSPSILGVTGTKLGDGLTVVDNPKPNKFHASGLDAVVEQFDCDYLMALETDVAVLRHGWLQWFMDHLESYQHFAMVGHWHHEAFINPSCTLYRASVLRDMLKWCQANTSDDCRWGQHFEKVKTMDTQAESISVRGPFAEKRGWPEGTVLREPPSGQCKGPGWYEPGQALYAWARHNGDLGYLAVPTFDVFRSVGWPVHTHYGVNTPENREYELSELFGAGPYACHFWRGTGALNILKHCDVDLILEPQFRDYCLPREARFWLQAVDQDVREETLDLIRNHGWHTKGCMTDAVTDRDIDGVRVVEECYARGGVVI